MIRSLRGAVVVVAVLAVGGCGNPASQVSTVPAPGGGPGTWPGGPGGGAAGSSAIRDIMARLTKGPMSLQTVIGEELKAPDPAWDKIQPQAKEYAQLAATMGKNDPPRGSKESWAALSKGYADAAAALDAAAQARDHDAAVTAHGKLAMSCMPCHREHRSMRPGMPPQ